MLILKILGFSGIALLVLLAVVLLLPIRLMIATDENGKIKGCVQVLGLSFTGKASGNEGSQDKIKKLVLGDRLANGEAVKELTQDEGIGVTVHAVISLIENVFRRVKRLLSKCRVRRLLTHITVAHEDAAVAAIEYGSISAGVYSLAGVIDANMKVDKDALDVRVFCDFGQTKPSYVLDICLSLRIFWLVAAVLMLLYQNKKDNQYKK